MIKKIMMNDRIIFYAWGHPNIRATHESTFEITRENHLSLKGDCIVAVKSQYACRDLPNQIKRRMKNKKTKITLILEAEGVRDKVEGYGSEKLILASPVSMVIRKSSYIDERTLMIKANKSASDLDRKLISKLKKSEAKARITIIID